MDSLRSGFDTPRVKTRAELVVSDVLAKYNFKATQLSDQQTLELFCCFGGLEVSPDILGTREGDIVHIGVRTMSENETRIEEISEYLVPVEQVSFTIVVSEKQSEKPPKEIGFHAINEEPKNM